MRYTPGRGYIRTALLEFVVALLIIFGIPFGVLTLGVLVGAQ
jgi:hypothetical protein